MTSDKTVEEISVENEFQGQGLAQLAQTIGAATNEVKSTGSNLLKISDEAQRLAKDLSAIKQALKEGQALGGQTSVTNQTTQQGNSQIR